MTSCGSSKLQQALALLTKRDPILPKPKRIISLGKKSFLALIILVSFSFKKSFDFIYHLNFNRTLLKIINQKFYYLFLIIPSY